MRSDGRTRRLIRDLVAAVAAFVIVFAVAYVAGRAAVPVFPVAIGELPATGDQATDSGEVPIVSLWAELAALEAPAALVASSGAVDATITFDRGQSLRGGFFPEEVDDSETPKMDVHARFTGSNASLLIKAEQMIHGESRNQDMTVVLTIDGMTFNPRAGMCTLELRDFGLDTMRRPWGTLLLPWYDGQLVCAGVPELRSGETASFSAVFIYREH